MSSGSKDSKLSDNEQEHEKKNGKADEPTQRYHKSDANKSNLTKEEEALRDAIVDLMDSYGQRVITDDVMGQSVIDYVNGEETSLSKAQKRALETVSVSSNEEHQQTVVSSAAGANILKDLGKLAKDLDNLTQNNTKSFLSDVEVNPDNSDSYRDMRFSANGNGCRVAANEEGKITLAEGLGEDAVGKSLGEVFGKEVAIEIMGADKTKRIQLEGKRIGGEGMKGFYDKMLPSFMNKYGKKWGVKVGEVTLPNVEESARKMWSVDVTPEMKESVMQGQPMFLRGGAVQLTPQEVALRDAIVDLMDSYGQKVITDDVMGQSVINYVNGEETSLSKAHKRALETASLIQTEGSPADISSADVAKVQNNLETLANKYDNLTKNSRKNFLEEVATELGATEHGSKSKYVTIEAKNGNIVTIRLANHNAKVSTFDKNDEDNGISIVVSKRANEGITNDGNAHVVEYYYPETGLRRVEGKPLADIVRAIEQSLYSGEFKDPTGIAERQEVNADNIREMRVYHGSGADFDAFDHSHMGEGEGAQAYGWGSYVTEVKGIGKAYAQSTSSPTYKGYDRETLDSSRDLSIPHAEKIAARIMLKNLRGSLPDAIERTKRFFEKRAEIFGKRSDWTNKDFMDYFGCSRSEVREYREESQKKAQAYREYLEALNKIDESDVHQKERILYTVEIPNEAGVHYISYKDRMSDQNNILEAVDNALAAQGWKRQEKYTKLFCRVTIMMYLCSK